MNHRTLFLFVPLVLFLSVGVAAGSFYEVSPYQEPGHLAFQSPQIEALASGKEIEVSLFSLSATHKISGSFRILEKDTHSLGYDAQLAPYDFLVGWAEMSSLGVLPQFSFSVGGRHFSWEAKTLPLDFNKIEEALALLAVVPADKRVAQRLLSLRRYDIVSLEGYVVTARHPDGWLLSGRVPGDADPPGAAYLLYVERLAVGEPLERIDDPLTEGFFFKKQVQKTQVSSPHVRD